MQFLGMFRHVRTSHAQGLTKEMFVSLGQSAVSARDVYAQGGLIVMAEGEMRNRNTLARTLKLSYDASMSLITARAYRMWGADYPRHIEGAVMTAVIDRTEDRMIVSADRAGAIGVYYAWRGRSAAFASHPELLLKMGAAGRKIGREGLCELFATGGFFTPGKTAFRDIRVLEGGCVLIADSRGMRVKRYYSVLSEAVRENLAPFTAADYIETLPQAEYALFLSGGLSFQMAQEMKKTGRGVLYHAQTDLTEDGDALMKRLNAPVEVIVPRAEAYVDSLKESVTHTGFPGAGAGDGVLLPMMKEAFCLFPSVILGGMRAFLCESMVKGNLLRFLRKDVLRLMDAQGYLRDRFNDLTDKMRMCVQSEESERQSEHMLCALSLCSQFALRMRLLAGASGGEVRTPLSDERFLASMLSGLPETENAHSPNQSLSGECAEKIMEETREMVGSEDQPIFEAVDPSLIKRELASEMRNASDFARLIQINSFLYQFEAELSLA